MATGTEDLESILAIKEVEYIIRRLKRLNKTVERSKMDIINEILLYALNVDAKNNANTNSEATSSTMDDKPKSIPDKYNEAIVKEICGEVNTNIKQLFGIHHCNLDKEIISMKVIKQKHKKSLKLFGEMSTIMKRLSDDFIEDKKEFMVSVWKGTYPKTASTKSATYPLRIDKDPPIMVLGPYGTEVPESEYAKIRWTSPKGATRMLFGLVFDYSAVLLAYFAHSLLDPYKISDIEYCVKVNTKGADKVIREAIAKKAYETQKKYMKLRAKILNNF
ncbi:uncharacterized protein LOC129248226 [Anastrepha obliqua]|uniref:uncharacterized protein LOC129248226 n=1 Tax=Anastrepha obliqua TaxID=95512 RepID=UPI0024097F9F|nr:uncharacterized protein LOC129248226 [Anastrepha obliqua]